MAGYICVISAASAAGKTSLVNAVLQAYGSHKLSRVVTYTTRAPRPGEQDGVDYHFVSHERFWQLCNAGHFIEYSSAYGAYYASAWDSIYDIPSGHGRIMVIDRNGAYRVIQACDNVVSIWITPSDSQVLRHRLEARGLPNDDIAHRVRQSYDEMRIERESPIYDHWIINDTFEDARDALHACIATYIA